MICSRAGASAGHRSYRLNSVRSEEHTSELQSRLHLACRLLLGQKYGDLVTSTMNVFRRSSASVVTHENAPSEATIIQIRHSFIPHPAARRRPISPRGRGSATTR